MPNHALNRRQFLRIMGVSGAAGIALKLGVDLATRREAVTETRLLMGTLVNLTLITDDPQVGVQAIAACLDHMASLESVFSRFQTDSQLSRLNAAGQLQNPSPHLVNVLHEANRLSGLTGGAFDVTVKPLVDLYQAARDQGTLPAPDAIAQTLSRVDYRALAVSDTSIAFARPGMALTLDGIAKGYIVDQGTAILAEYGYDNVLVEAGGDLAAQGNKASAVPWRIGVQMPRPGEQPYLTTLPVGNQAVATSGDYMQPFSADYTEHHILNPLTGHSSPQLASATVFAPTCALADALATAMMVLPPAQSMALLGDLPGCDAYLVGKDLHIWQSPGLQIA